MISRQVKQGLKTGLAGLIAYLFYAHFGLREGYWAVFTALVVTQANLGASWQAAFYRTVGTTCGALSAALLAGLIGNDPIRTGVLLFVLASIFAYLTTRHPSFSAAGFTVALVLFFSHQQEPGHLAWYRVLYTVLGAVIAFAVGVLVWPVRAREGLRKKIAQLLEECARLTELVTGGALKGDVAQQDLDDLAQTITIHRRAITQGLEEARNEPGLTRFARDAYVSFVDEMDHLRLRLLAMRGDTVLYASSGLQANLVPSLPVLCLEIQDRLSEMAAALREGRPVTAGATVGTAARVEADLVALRSARTTAPFTLDRMLPFWSFVFNLLETAGSIESLEQRVKELIPE